MNKIKKYIINKILKPILWDETYIKRCGDCYELRYKENERVWVILDYNPQYNTMELRPYWYGGLKKMNYVFGMPLQILITDSMIKEHFAEKMGMDPGELKWA